MGERPGLQVLERIQPHASSEYELVIRGCTDDACLAPGTGRRPARPDPTGEDLLVPYLGQPADPVLIQRLVNAGGQVVPARNPYWDQWGVTITGPDGYRLLLSHRTWQ